MCIVCLFLIFNNDYRNYKYNSIVTAKVYSASESSIYLDIVNVPGTRDRVWLTGSITHIGG